MENYYEILHVANFAEIEVVKAAYRAVTKLYHPDTNSSVDPNVIVKINLAYEVIGNPEKKERYDEELRSFLKTEKKTVNENTYSARENAKPEERAPQSEKNEPKTKMGKVARTIGSGLWFIVDSFLDGARELQKEAENAYYQGCDFDNWTLVRNYLKSTGARRHGYAKVLIERGLLCEENGELIPSYEFKNIARYM